MADEVEDEGGGTAKSSRPSSAFLAALRSSLRTISLDGWSAVALAVILGALALVLGYTELLIIAFALVVAWLIAVVVALRGSGISAERIVAPQRVKEGDPSSGLLTIRNEGRLRAPPALALELFDGRREIPIPLPSIPAGSEHVHSYPLDTTARGRFRVGPLRFGRADPFRFVRTATARGNSTHLIVHPFTYHVPPMPSGRVRDLEGTMQSKRAQGGIAFHNLREYVPGDDRRLIHWRSSAKTDTLMVKHNVVTHEPSLAIVLDTSGVYSDSEAFEDAVRVAASLMVSGVRDGFPTALHTTSGHGGAVDQAGEDLMKLMDLLASIRINKNDLGLGYLPNVAGARRRETTLGVVTGTPDSSQLAKVSKVASRFDSVNTIVVGDRFDRATPVIPGSFVMRAATASEWANLWKARFG